MIDSYFIKAYLFRHWRLLHQYTYMATEVGQFSADFVLLEPNNKHLKEFEIKTSVADLKNDIKKDKHKVYSGETPTGSYCQYKNPLWKPNFFTFVVPNFIAEKAEEVIKKEFPFYGLMVLEDKDTFFLDLSCRTPIKAKLLPNSDKTDKDIEDLKIAITRRLCNDVYSHYALAVGRKNIYNDIRACVDDQTLKDEEIKDLKMEITLLKSKNYQLEYG